MITERVETNIVMAGWVVAFLLGLFLLLIKTPHNNAYVHYNWGKKTCAAALLFFGCELLFQWFMHILEIADPILSVSVYLLTFCAVTLLVAIGYCSMMSPELVTGFQRRIAISTLGVFAIILIINYFLPVWRWRVRGVLVCSVLLFILTCYAIYTIVIVYRKAINNLRKYYADFIENFIRWMPSVGIVTWLFLISAPFIVWLPRWCGIFQVALGIIMFIYSFICIMNFSTDYGSYAATLGDPSEQTEDAAVEGVSEGADVTEVDEPEEVAGRRRGFTLSDSLTEVIQDKVARWCERGGYRTPGITIEQAAREMGTNRSYLSRYLNEVRQVTFYEWVAKMRIAEAQSLMMSHPSDSIEQIASRVGFSSPSTFSITFKKMVGKSPNVWRSQQ